MSYDEINEKYRLDDICPEIDNELNGFFVDLLGDDFELGIFPEPNPENENKFSVTVEINCDDADLDDGSVSAIKKAVEERLAHNIGSDWKNIKKYFSGVQIYLNDEMK